MPDHSSTNAAHPERVRRSRLSLVLSLLGMVVIVGLLLWVVPIEALGADLAGADPLLVAMAVLISLGHRHLGGPDKWRRTVTALGMPLGFRSALFIWLGSYTLREVLPLRSGDLAKAAYLWRRRGYPFDRLVSTLVFDRACNLLGIFTVLVVGLALSSTQVPLSLAPLPVLVAVGMVLMLVSARVRGWVLWPFGKLGTRVARFTEGLLAAWREISGAGKALLTIYAIAYQGAKVVVLYLLLRSVGVTVPPAATVLLAALTMLTSNTPVTISGVGTREASVLVFFAPFGTRSALLAAAVLFTACEALVPVLVSLPFLPSFLVRLRKAGD